MKQYKVILH